MATYDCCPRHRSGAPGHKMCGESNWNSESAAERIARKRIGDAAPDLLAALTKVVNYATRPTPDSTGQDIVTIRAALLDQCRAAIAKAEGK